MWQKRKKQRIKINYVKKSVLRNEEKRWKMARNVTVNATKGTDRIYIKENINHKQGYTHIKKR